MIGALVPRARRTEDHLEVSHEVALTDEVPERRAAAARPRCAAPARRRPARRRARSVVRDRVSCWSRAPHELQRRAQAPRTRHSAAPRRAARRAPLGWCSRARAARLRSRRRRGSAGSLGSNDPSRRDHFALQFQHDATGGLGSDARDCRHLLRVVALDARRPARRRSSCEARRAPSRVPPRA